MQGYRILYVEKGTSSKKFETGGTHRLASILIFFSTGSTDVLKLL